MNAFLSIQITTPSGAAQSFSVESESARIGTAAYCEIRLPLGEAAPEHVALEVRGLSGLYAEALSFEPAPTINGAPFSRAPLAPDALLEIGATQIRAAVVGAGATNAAAPNKSKSSPWVYVVAALALPYVLSNSALVSAEPEQPPTEFPALFTKKASCAQIEPSAALAFAREQLALADAKRERRPFHAADGVAAVGLYRSAAACFALATDNAAANEARVAADALERELDESYRTHRVRLEHALSIGDHAVARREACALLDLTSGHGGEYVSWLSNLQRRLGLSAEKKP